MNLLPNDCINIIFEFSAPEDRDQLRQVNKECREMITETIKNVRINFNFKIDFKACKKINQKNKEEFYKIIDTIPPNIEKLIINYAPKKRFYNLLTCVWDDINLIKLEFLKLVVIINIRFTTGVETLADVIFYGNQIIKKDRPYRIKQFIGSPHPGEINYKKIIIVNCPRAHNDSNEYECYFYALPIKEPLKLRDNWEFDLCTFTFTPNNNSPIYDIYDICKKNNMI